MQITNIGYNHCHDADFRINRPCGSGDNLLVLLRSDGIFELDGKEITAHTDSVILYREGTPQLYRASGPRFVNDWFHFTMTDEDLTFLDALDIPFDEILPLGNINELSLFIKNMCYENYSSNVYRADSTELYMKLFFIKLSEKLHFSSGLVSGSNYDKMSILRSKIYNMPYHEWSIAGLAHELAMSESYFQHLYRRSFGISPMNDVIRSRIEHSKYLLSTTDIPVAQISEMCGYKCELHFLRQFRSRMDMTPTEYRRASSESIRSADQK